MMVHIHDIFIPDDYPTTWKYRVDIDQYMLKAMLLCGRAPFRVSPPVSHVCKDAALSARVRRIFAAPGRGPDIPFLYPNDAYAPEASFWLEIANSAADLPMD